MLTEKGEKRSLGNRRVSIFLDIFISLFLYIARNFGDEKLIVAQRVRHSETENCVSLKEKNNQKSFRIQSEFFRFISICLICCAEVETDRAESIQ